MNWGDARKEPGRNENAWRGPCWFMSASDPSTTHALARSAQARVPLRMTGTETLLHYGGGGVGGFFFVGVDFAVVFGVERAVLGV